jgi:hypothetical protein
VDAATKLREELLKFVAPWPSAEAPKPSESAPEAADMAVRVRAKYDSMIRWVLGVFTAVGILIFGSVPFTDLKGIAWWPWASCGLALAGLGLGVVVWATTKGLEPQDASLGEIKDTFTALDESEPRPWKPLKRSNWRLKQILAAIPNEASAHLGPGVTSVSGLIVRLGQLESQVFEAEVGWSGKPAHRQNRR